MSSISYSEVSSYRRCQKAWEYRYKLRIKRVRKYIRMLKGEMLHEMLNAHIARKMNKKYKGPDPWDVLEKYAEKYATYFEEEREHYGDIIGDCGEIFEGYLRKYRKDPLIYERTEESVYFDIGKVRFKGIIDKVACDAQERRWIVDHKFVANIPTAEDRFSELQLLLYVWAWEKTHPDEPIDGVCWDYGRSKAPTKPEVLKSGELSKRKNIDCDPHTYRATVLAHGKNLDDYQDMLELLEGKENTFYERVFLPKPSDTMVEIITDDFLESTREIQEKRKPAARCTRSMTPFNCNTCEYRQLCEAEVRGLDTEFIMKSEYRDRNIADEVYTM